MLDFDMSAIICMRVTKAITAYHAPRVDIHTIANKTITVDNNIWINFARFPNADIRANHYPGHNHTALTNTHILSNMYVWGDLHTLCDLILCRTLKCEAGLCK